MENPNRYPTSGVFRFKFWVKDQWIGINIDNKLPMFYYKSKKLPVGAKRSEKNGWWVALFEKAFAKFNQNYDRIQGGSPFESLRTLTGKPIKSYIFK